jgi:putative endonuclease
MKKNSYQFGLFAEFIAALFLLLKGYRIVERRYKTPVGEIDLIAKQKGVLVFVEVKARKDMCDALGAITPGMKKRITRAAESYISHNPQISDMPMRFDLIALESFLNVRHLVNAW